MQCSQMHQCSIRRTVCVRVCVCFSPVLGRAALIGSQTRGISVLHNRVRRHREDRPRDLLSASERRASFGIQQPLIDITGSALREEHRLTHFRDLIIMIVWAGLLHAYALWTVTCHKHGKLCVCAFARVQGVSACVRLCVCVCVSSLSLLRNAVGVLLQMCYG